MSDEQRGELAQVNRHYIDALSTSSAVRPRSIYGMFLLKNRRCEDALDLVVQMNELEPGNADVFNLLGAILAQKRHYDQAESAFHMAAALDRHAPNAHLNLARLALLQGDTDRAAQSYRIALGLQPNNAAVRCELARVLWQHGDVEAAKHELLLAKTDAPRNQQITDTLREIHLGHPPKKILSASPVAAGQKS